MRHPWAILLCAVPLWAQGDEFRVYTEAPRLLLTPQRWRLVQRERERDSLRWQSFNALLSGGAAMPEPGFAWSLYYRASREPAWGEKAVDWALSDEAKDLRQLALVFDWCSPVMTAAQIDRLGTKLERALAAVSSAPE